MYYDECLTSLLLGEAKIESVSIPSLGLRYDAELGRIIHEPTGQVYVHEQDMFSVQRQHVLHPGILVVNETSLYTKTLGMISVKK